MGDPTVGKFFRLSPEVAQFLDTLPARTQTEYVEQAIRAAMENQTGKQKEAATN
jgi:predicted DNA-binding protein